jgi:hypothetical protein
VNQRLGRRACAQVGVTGEREETIGDGIDQTVSNLYIPAFGGDVVPDFVQVNGRSAR